jgi:hypothetical protein
VFDEGELQNDLPHGKGKQIYSVPKFKRKSEYTGDFNNGVMEGYGKAIIITGPSKGSKYEGEWKNGEEWKGTRYDKDGDIDYKVVNGVRQQ